MYSHQWAFLSFALSWLVYLASPQSINCPARSVNVFSARANIAGLPTYLSSGAEPGIICSDTSASCDHCSSVNLSDDPGRSSVICFTGKSRSTNFIRPPEMQRAIWEGIDTRMCNPNRNIMSFRMDMAGVSPNRLDPQNSALSDGLFLDVCCHDNWEWTTMDTSACDRIFTYFGSADTEFALAEASDSNLNVPQKNTAYSICRTIILDKTRTCSSVDVIVQAATSAPSESFAIYGLELSCPLLISTPSNSQTMTPTITPSASKTRTKSPTRTSTRTPSQTSSHSTTVSAQESPSVSPSGSVTETGTQTTSSSPSSSVTPSLSSFSTPSMSPTTTKTRSQTGTASRSITATRTDSPSPTKSPSSTKSLSITITTTKTSSESSTSTKSISNRRTESPTSSATFSPSGTASPTQTVTSTHTISAPVTPLHTNMVTPSQTRTTTRTPTRTQTATPSSTRTSSKTPSKSKSESKTLSPSRSESHSASTTRTGSHTRTSTASHSESTSTSYSRTTSRTNTPTRTATATSSASFSASGTETATSSPSSTPSPSITTSETTSPSVSLTPTITVSGSGTKSMTPTTSTTPSPSRPETMTMTSRVEQSTNSFSPSVTNTKTASITSSGSSSVTFSPSPSTEELLQFILPPVASPNAEDQFSFSSTRTKTPQDSQEARHSINSTGVTVGGGVIISGEGYFVAINSNSSFVIREGDEIAVESAGDSLGSRVVNIQLLDEDGNPVQPSSEIEICLQQDGKQSKEDLCLASYSEDMQKWSCDDSCLEETKDKKLCGNVDHLTNFALLLQGGGRGGSKCASSINNYILGSAFNDMMLVMSCFIVCYCFVLLVLLGSQLMQKKTVLRRTMEIQYFEE